MTPLRSLAAGGAPGADLARALAGRFPQTVLLSGDDAGALDALSTTLAAGLLCEAAGDKPCGACVSCRKVEGSVHPDLSVIDEGESELKIDLARRIKAENAIIPNDGARRVTIVRHAQNLNPAAQNALLKELEEPPAYAFFILTAEQPDALLETVRSRCTKFTLAPSADTLPADEAVQLLAPYLAALGARREEGLMAAALTLEKTPRRALLALLGVLQTALRDALFAAHALPQPPLLPALAAETAAVARTVSPERLLRVHDFVAVLSERVSRNAAAAAVTCALTSDVYQICFC